MPKTRSLNDDRYGKACPYLMIVPPGGRRVSMIRRFNEHRYGYPHPSHVPLPSRNCAKKGKERRRQGAAWVYTHAKQPYQRKTPSSKVPLFDLTILETLQHMILYSTFCIFSLFPFLGWVNELRSYTESSVFISFAIFAATLTLCEDMYGMVSAMQKPA